jgi:hypothetical protein
MKQTGRVTKHAIAVAQRARRGPPPAGDSAGEQFIRARAVVPHGDRRDFALSGRLQNQCQPVPPRRNYVVGEFVERDCFSQQHRRTPGAPPEDELLQRAEARQFAFERSQRFDWEVCSIGDLHGTEFSSKRRRNQRFVGQTLVCPWHKLSAIPGLKRADPGQRAWQKNGGKKNEQSSLFPLFLPGNASQAASRDQTGNC